MKSLLLLWPAVLAILTGCAKSEPTSDTGQARYAMLGTNRVRYVTIGNGPSTIVFVHGWSCNGGFWREQIPVLVDRARLILVDLPGHGKSDAPRTRYTMDYLASGVIAVMDDAGVDKAVLVGHSMGTPIICRVYAQAPGKVAGVVAVDGVLLRPDLPLEQREGLRQFIAAMQTPEYQEPLRQFINSMFPSPDSTTVNDWVYKEAVRTPRHVMLSAMECMFDPSEPDWDPKHVEIPVLAIHAPNPMWTADYQAYVRGLSTRSDYRTLEDVGHYIMLEKPAEFNATFLEMLQDSGLITE